MNWDCLYRENQLYYCIYDCRFVGQITKPHMQQISFHSRSIFFLSINSLTAMLFFLSFRCIAYNTCIFSPIWILIENKFIFFLFVLVVFFGTDLVRFGSLYCIAIHIQFYTHIVDKMSQMRQRKKKYEQLTTKTVQCIGCFAFGIADKMRYLLKLASCTEQRYTIRTDIYAHTHAPGCIANCGRASVVSSNCTAERKGQHTNHIDGFLLCYHR